MEIIKEYVENLIQLCGVSGSAVPVVRHVALVLVTLLLAWLSGVLCKRIIMPYGADYGRLGRYFV